MRILPFHLEFVGVNRIIPEKKMASTLVSYGLRLIIFLTVFI